MSPVGNTNSEYTDFWDLKDLQRTIPTITAAEFIRHHGDQFELPASNFPGRSNGPDDNPWKKFMRTHATQVAGCGEVCGKLQREKDSPLVHVSLEHGNRVFQCAPCDTARKEKLTDYLHYTPEITRAAAAAVAQIGLFEYVALHLRRNDFQYKTADDPVHHMDNLKKALQKNENIYIATDELDDEYLAKWKAELPGHRIYSSKDFKESHFKSIGWRKQGGLIEQVVCAGSRVFLGMPMSTYSGNIKNIRRNMAKLDGAPELVNGYVFSQGMTNPSYDAR